MVTTKLGTVCYRVEEIEEGFAVHNGDGQIIEIFGTKEQADEFADSEERRMEAIINNNI